MNTNFSSATGFVDNSFYPSYEGAPYGVAPQVYPYPVGGMEQVAQKISSIPLLANVIAESYSEQLSAALPYETILPPDLLAYSY